MTEASGVPMRWNDSPKIRRPRRWDGQSGAELIEFALVFPILLMTVLGIVDFGFLFHRQEVVTNAAREGARVAALPGYTATDVQDRVRELHLDRRCTDDRRKPGGWRECRDRSARCRHVACDNRQRFVFA